MFTLAISTVHIHNFSASQEDKSERQMNPGYETFSMNTKRNLVSVYC